MVAASVQLQSKGLEDLYLTDKPESSVFQYVYYRIINFATDTLQLPLDNSVEFNSKSQIIIPKKGHLLSKLYLNIKLPKLIKKDGTYACWTDAFGYAFFDGPIELQIGGIVVDRLYSVGLDLVNELTVSDKRVGLDRMILKSDIFRANIHNAKEVIDLMIPLDFWFTKDYSLALPLLSITNQDIQINFSFKDFSSMINYDGNMPPNPVSILDSSVFAEYIYLDDIVLDTFQKKEHMYVIDQMLFNGGEIIPANTSIYSTKINCLNPCKEILFACVDQANILNNNYFNYSRSMDGGSIVTDITLLLDGRNRFNNDYLPEFIFREYYPNNIHSVIPSKHMYCIPFSIKPEWNGQPSGTINLGRFDEVTLNLKLSSGNNNCYLYIFPIVHNIVKISNGVLSFEWFTQ